jgi:DNA-binding PadR family transcriptional regulator
MSRSRISKDCEGMADRIVEPQELSRSCNELLVMAAIARGAGHGYQLALDVEEKSGGAFRFNHGTLYPILHRLEERGLVAGAWSDDSSGGRRRKSYALTQKGEKHLVTERKAWGEFFDRFWPMVEVGR